MERCKIRKNINKVLTQGKITSKEKSCNTNFVLYTNNSIKL